MKLKNIKFYYLLIVILSMIVSSCGTTLVPGPVTTEIVYDTVFVNVQSDGDLIETTAGKSFRPDKKIVLSGDGDEASFKAGDKIKLIIDGIDFCQSTIKVEKNDYNDNVKLKVVPLIDGEIVLTTKCQIVRWMDPDILPIIRIYDITDKSPSLKNDQQIILTPLYNSDCERIGYEIRYGSVERGCKSPALGGFGNCNKMVKSRSRKEKGTSFGNIFGK